jgi:hypothetical protein
MQRFSWSDMDAESGFLCTGDTYDLCGDDTMQSLDMSPQKGVFNICIARHNPSHRLVNVRQPVGFSQLLIFQGLHSDTSEYIFLMGMLCFNTFLLCTIRLAIDARHR